MTEFLAWTVAMAICAWAPALGSSDGRGLVAKLTGPAQVQAAEPFVLTVEIANTSSRSFLHRQHWKWARNTMSIEAKGPDAGVTRSDPLLFDIGARADCFYTKPLSPGDRFTFEVPINRRAMATLQLHFPGPDRYHLAWVYEFTPEDSDVGPPCFDVPFWKGRLRSNSIAVDVVK